MRSPTSSLRSCFASQLWKIYTTRYRLSSLLYHFFETSWISYFFLVQHQPKREGMTGEFLRADGLAAGRKPSATAIRKHPRMPHRCPAARIERRMPTHGRGHGTRPGKDFGPSEKGFPAERAAGPRFLSGTLLPTIPIVIHT